MQGCRVGVGGLFGSYCQTGPYKNVPNLGSSKFGLQGIVLRGLMKGLRVQGLGVWGSGLISAQGYGQGFRSGLAWVWGLPGLV